MSQFKFKLSKRIQKLANTKDHHKLEAKSDLKRTLDVNDCDDSTGGYIDGVLAGVRLVHKAQAADRGWSDIFLVRFPDYADNDGVALFVGTEAQVYERIFALPDREDLKEEQEAEKELRKNPPPPPPEPLPNRQQGAVYYNEVCWLKGEKSFGEAKALVPMWGLEIFERVNYRDFILMSAHRAYSDGKLTKLEVKFIHKNQRESERDMQFGWYKAIELDFIYIPFMAGDKPETMKINHKDVTTMAELDSQIDAHLRFLYPPKEG